MLFGNSNHTSRVSAFTALFLATLGVLILPAAPAQADSFTFVFDYFDLPPHTTGSPPISGGPFGTITIKDSILDTNRVDIDLKIENVPAPYNGVALEQFYLNFNNDTILSGNNIFYLVTQTAATPANSNSNPFPAGDVLGGVQKGNDTLTLTSGFTFDVNPDPTSVAYTFNGSLAFYGTLTNPDLPINLDASMFNLTGGGNGVPEMYAAFRLVNGPQSIGEFWAFASSTATPVPEPASMVLLGTGLLGGAWKLRRRKNTTEKS